MVVAFLISLQTGLEPLLFVSSKVPGDLRWSPQFLDSEAGTLSPAILRGGPARL